jgi:hypothetical protein
MESGFEKKIVSDPQHWLMCIILEPVFRKKCLLVIERILCSIVTGLLTKIITTKVPVLWYFEEEKNRILFKGAELSQRELRTGCLQPLQVAFN